MTTDRRGIAAMSALAAAAVLFAFALARALTIEPLAEPRPAAAGGPGQPATDSPADPPRVASETTLLPGDVALAVDNDPFQPDRRRPEPYRLPGEEVPETAPGIEPPPAPDFRVVGTVVADDGGLAVIAVADSPPRIIGVGESVQGYRLERVGATSATLVGAGHTLELALEVAAPEAASSGRNRSGQATAQLNPQMLRTLQQRFGEGFTAVLERLQQSGPAGQAQIQALIERAMANVQRGGGPGMRVRRDTLDTPARRPGNR